jgi:hypothetical protein
LLTIFAADPTGSLDLAVFAQYGVLGILALMLIFFARGAHQRERDRADRLEAENQRLHELIIDRVIPALGSATRAAEEAADLLSAMQREREFAALALRRRDLEGGP